MKRIWIGIALLVSVLVSGIWVSHYMERSHMAMAEDLDRAAQLVLQEQWTAAESLTARARQNWEKGRPVTACFAEHEPLDEIDALFAQMKIYGEVRDEISYGSSCAWLAERLRALSRSHKFTFRNLM